MDTFTKRLIVITLVVLGLIGVIGYLGYRFYNYAIADASQRIQTGVSQGVSQGMKKGVGGMLNPLSLPKKFLGK